MAKLPTIEEMAQNVAEKALDGIEYEGKTLREWVKIILATDTNVATKVSTNLAEVGTDCISRQNAIEVIERARAHIGHNMERAVGRVFLEMLDDVGLSISKLPPAEPKRGRWIGKYPVTSVCSECGFLIHDSKVKAFAYCPNCGADMRGEQDG